jgi:2-haloacid dehalogenase
LQTAKRENHEGTGKMTCKALVFDIGGTVFDWNTAILEVLDRVLPPETSPAFDRSAFALTCRANYLDTISRVVTGKAPWATSDETLQAVVNDALVQFGIGQLPIGPRLSLAQAWRTMPAWPGAKEAIASLRASYLVVPLTILSWSMAVGSSRRNGIDWDSILSCDVLGIYKPDPRVYARAAQILECRPHEIAMVASHPSDLRAAMAAGFKSVYVVPRLQDPGDDYTDSGFASEFDLVVQNFKELAERINTLVEG